MGEQFRFLLVTISLLLLFSVTAASGEEKPSGKFLGAKETVYPDWFKESFLDLSEDVDEAREQGRRLLLFFHQNGCPYCNLMVERNLSQREIRQRMQESLDVVAINMWGDREITGFDGSRMTEKNFSAALRVQFTPTLIFLDEAGGLALRLNGYLPPEEFKVALDYVTNHKEKEISYQEYLAGQRSPKSSGQLNRQPFFQELPYDLSTGERPVAVFFEQGDCPDCDRLHNEVLAVPEVRALASRFDSVQLDMWSDTPVRTHEGRELTAREWAKELGVLYAPTVVLFNREDGEIIRSEAQFREFHTASIFDYVLSGGYRQEKSFQRYISARAEHIREQGKDVDIFR
jgi:thioredoxin-related protein